MSRFRWLISLIILCCSFGSLFGAKRSAGHLLIIGGGDKPAEALKVFVEHSSPGKILVITSASSVPLESGPYVVDQLEKSGAGKVEWLHIAGPEMGNADSVVAKIDSASGIFFTGGIQERFMQRVGNTRSEKAIVRRYREGAVIGGTSAGAAVMSEVMITGNELIQKDTTNAFLTIQANNIETLRGIGFLDRVIIDQHFALRKRHNRLISVVLEHPELVGIGIDEDTAIWVHPDHSFRVYGRGSVIVYDGRKARSIHLSKDGYLGARNLRMHVLIDGDTFKMD